MSPVETEQQDGPSARTVSALVDDATMRDAADTLAYNGVFLDPAARLGTRGTIGSGASGTGTGLKLLLIGLGRPPPPVPTSLDLHFQRVVQKGSDENDGGPSAARLSKDGGTGLSKELLDKWLQHSGFLCQNRLQMPQNCRIVC